MRERSQQQLEDCKDQMLADSAGYAKSQFAISTSSVACEEVAEDTPRGMLRSRKEDLEAGPKRGSDQLN